LRPPIAQERLTLRSDGSFIVTLKTPWRDGTTHLRFEPMTLLERLATLTPRPRIIVLLYHGVLAPHARWRPAAVVYGRLDAAGTPADGAHRAGPPVDGARPPGATPGGATRSDAVVPVPAPRLPAAPAPGTAATGPEAADHPPAGAFPPRRWSWAELLQRVFAVDVLACPRCGGRMRVIATIDDPAVVRRILTHLGVPGAPGPPPGPWPAAAA
jgi:hypothetical protein